MWPSPSLDSVVGSSLCNSENKFRVVWVFKQRKVFEKNEEVKKSQNDSLPKEYKERISRIEENCKKYN